MRRPRWVETRLAEVMTLDCLGTELDEELEVHWIRRPAKVLAAAGEGATLAGQPGPRRQFCVAVTGLRRTELVAKETMVTVRLEGWRKVAAAPPAAGKRDQG